LFIRRAEPNGRSDVSGRLFGDHFKTVGRNARMFVIKRIQAINAEDRARWTVAASNDDGNRIRSEQFHARENKRSPKTGLYERVRFFVFNNGGRVFPFTYCSPR